MSRTSSVKGEEEVVSTSFSPRVHAYPGRPWPLDQPPGTPHKRPSALKNVKTSTVPELDPPSRRTVSVGRSKLGIQQDKSLALPYRRDDELVQRRPQRISESGAVKKPISRTSSFKRNLSSLTDVSASATLPPRGSTNVDLQRALPYILLSLGLLSFLFKALPGVTFSGWVLPDSLAAQGSLQFLFFVLFLSATAALLRLPPSQTLGFRASSLPFSLPFPLTFPLPWPPPFAVRQNPRVYLQLSLHLASRYLRLGPKSEDSFWLMQRGRQLADKVRRQVSRMWARVKGRTEGGGSPREQPGGSGGEARGINKWFQDPPEFPPPALPGVQGLGVYLYPGGARYEGEMYRGRCSGSGVYYFRITEDPSKGASGFGFFTSSSGTVSNDGATYFGTQRIFGCGVEYGFKPHTVPLSGPLGGTALGMEYGTDVRTLTGNGFGRYEGDWVDGRYNGYGVEAYRNGAQYKGQFKRGYREGYGVYSFPSGDRYSGAWKRGQSEGVGLQMCSDGSRFLGEFKGGEKHGLGVYKYRNGDVYCGQYFRDRMNGFGVYRFARNEHYYEGSWFQGKKEGFGAYHFQDGQVREGYWHNGRLFQSTTVPACTVKSTEEEDEAHSQEEEDEAVLIEEGRYFPNPGEEEHPVFVADHSKVLHAIQESREAAEEAQELMVVESFVSKAVAAAMKSAMAARVIAARARNQGTPPVVVDP